MLLSPRALRFALSHRRLGIFHVSGDGDGVGVTSVDEIFGVSQGIGLTFRRSLRKSDISRLLAERQLAPK